MGFGCRVRAVGSMAALVAAVMALLSIAFASHAAAKKNGPILFTTYDDIYKVQPSGSGLKKISSKDARNIAPSGNGKSLAYTNGKLMTMRINGSHVKDVLKKFPTVRNFADAYWADWSPNNRWIAFVGHNDGRIYLARPDGKKLVRVFGKNRTGLGYPHFSPDSKSLGFIDYNDDSSLKIVNLNTGKTKLVYSGADPRAGTPVNFDFNPNGRQIAFYAPYRDWIIDTDGSDLRQISPNQAFVSYEDPSYSPDGKQIVAESSSDLFLLDGQLGAASGGYATPLAPGFSKSMFSPAWAPKP